MIEFNFYLNKYILQPIYNLYCRKHIKNKSFTIISNNCWAGGIYQDLKLPYATPTIGLFFYPEDYICFLEDLKNCINAPLEFTKKSKYNNVNSKYPIGLINNKIEIHFLHYKTEKEAKSKWNRRVKRINWNNLYIKMDDRDGCTLDIIKRFDQLPFKDKIFFQPKSMTI